MKNKDVEKFEVKEVVLAPKVAKAPVVVEGKKVNFERYVVRKGIKASHVAGMKAFVRNPDVLMTMDAWDDLFKRY